MSAQYYIKNINYNIYCIGIKMAQRVPISLYNRKGGRKFL